MKAIRQPFQWELLWCGYAHDRTDRIKDIYRMPVLRLKEQREESWLGLFEQFFRFDKWNACRVQAAAICDSRLK
jgi:hypothetical protein